MNKYYTAVAAMVVFFMVIMLISVKFNIALAEKRRRASAVLFGLIIIGVICEWSGIMLNGASPSLIPLHTFVKTVELCLSPFIGLLCGRSFSDSKLESTIFYILCGNAVLEVVSAFSGTIFYVDAENVYHHGSLYVIYLAAYAIGIFYFVGRAAGISRQFQGKYGISIFLVVLFVLGCISVQLIDSAIKVDWLAISIGAIMLYKFYGDMLLQIDGLTGALNRWAYENTLQTLNNKAILLFFDVDKFKPINDTYGHAVGDTCLVEVAECLRKAYGNYGMCFRYGGDEFCVIMTRALDRVDKATGDFHKELEKRKEDNEWMPTVSCGYAEFDPVKDDVQEAMKRADEMMYQYKEAHRE